MGYDDRGLRPVRVTSRATHAQDAHGVAPPRRDLVHLARTQRRAPVLRQPRVVAQRVERRDSSAVGGGAQDVRRRRRGMERERTRQFVRRASRVAQETSHHGRLEAVARPQHGAAPSVDVASVSSHVFVFKFDVQYFGSYAELWLHAIDVKNDVITSLHRMSKHIPRKKRSYGVVVRTQLPLKTTNSSLHRMSKHTKKKARKARDSAMIFLRLPIGARSHTPTRVSADPPSFRAWTSRRRVVRGNTRVSEHPTEVWSRDQLPDGVHTISAEKRGLPTEPRSEEPS